jgi:hypothetical protein
VPCRRACGKPCAADSGAPSASHSRGWRRWRPAEAAMGRARFGPLPVALFSNGRTWTDKQNAWRFFPLDLLRWGSGFAGCGRVARRWLAAVGSRVVRSASHEDCLGRIRRER